MGNKPSKEISRRDAIKILAAVAGATALVNLPDKWTKPGMEVGVLPAHAQTSLGLHTLAAGPDDPDAGFCLDLISTVAITPPTPGISLRYVITTSPGVTVNPPAALTGTVLTNGVSLTIRVNPQVWVAGDFVRVTWSFVNASDGINSDDQIFTTILPFGGC